MQKLRRRRCKICREWFMPEKDFEKWCSQAHKEELAIKLYRKQNEARQAKLKKEQQAKEREKKDKLKIRKLAVKPLSYFKQQAQTAFNQFIRLRDRDEPCISCSETNPPDLHGGQWDCGHFLSVGAHPELRFDERNAYKQCKPCNAGSGKYSHKNATVTQKYEQRLVERFGQELIDWLRGSHDLPHWKREDYIRIRDEYRAKVKALKKKGDLNV